MASTYVNGNKTPYAQEKLTAMTASTALTAANITQALTTQAPFDRSRVADEVLITCETADVRYTVDGTTPTTTATTGIGHILSSGQALVVAGATAIKNFRAINAVDASGAALQVTYFRL